MILGLANQGSAVDRIALVIGNSKYPEGNELPNPANDAKALAKSLRDLDFTVIEKTDLASGELGEAILEFHHQISPSTEVALFFFAGHGIQIDGINYLLPIGKFEAAFQVKSSATKADEVLAAMEEAGAKRNVVVLDSCRNNPFSRSIRRSVRGGTAQEGLTPMDRPPVGTLIAFSTKAGATADDGSGVNSPYTETLLEALEDRPATGLELKKLFSDVAARVYKKTKQDPAIYSSGSFAEYYLVPGEAGPAGTDTAKMANTAETKRLEKENEKLKQQLAEINRKLEDGKITNELVEQLKSLQTRMEEIDQKMQEPKTEFGGLTQVTPPPPLPVMNTQRGVSPFMFPNSDTQVLSDAELSGLSSDELWIARNEIFARRGYIFQSSRGQTLARKLGGAYQGYTSDQDAIYSQFNEVEKANVEKIQRYEGR